MAATAGVVYREVIDADAPRSLRYTWKGDEDTDDVTDVTLRVDRGSGVRVLHGAATVAGQAIPRLTAVGADVFEQPLPAGHDVILVANLVHLLPPDKITELFRRLRAVADPSATLLLVDWWRTEQAPHPSARFGAGEFLVVVHSQVFSAGR